MDARQTARMEALRRRPSDTIRQVGDRARAGAGAAARAIPARAPHTSPDGGAPYVLYVTLNDQASDTAMALADRVRDLVVRRADLIPSAQRPPWLRGVPTLACVAENVALTGSHAIARIRELGGDTPRAGALEETGGGRSAAPQPQPRQPHPRPPTEDPDETFGGFEGFGAQRAPGGGGASARQTGADPFGGDGEDADADADFYFDAAAARAPTPQAHYSDSKITQAEIDAFVQVRRAQVSTPSA
jgi:hypothetical protein